MIATTLSLSDMITAAQARRARQQAEIDGDRARRLRQEIDDFHNRLVDFFGGIPEALDVTVEPRSYSSPTATFRYEDREYRLHEGRQGWWLTRLEERGEDDDRELPNIEFVVSLYTSERDRQDIFLLALSDLSKVPDTPAIQQTVVRESEPEPTLEDRFLSVLREFIRSESAA